MRSSPALIVALMALMMSVSNLAFRPASTHLPEACYVNPKDSFGVYPELWFDTRANTNAFETSWEDILQERKSRRWLHLFSGYDPLPDKNSFRDFVTNTPYCKTMQAIMGKP